MSLALFAAALAVAAAVPAEPATCVFGTAPPEACQVGFSVAGGTMRMQARGKSGKRAVFVGRRQSGWWSGTLDGAPAMAYERNRGNVVFSTRDLRRTFQYWTAGNEHGSY
ncbi:hypothetical protein [Sphingosinicella sp. BN140058]|uniref:hypothetical protein n=1 Tax=Sphingosinicella sp. BN140058 TaxID=1892855 RepID=UPI001010ED67|nr:hypothetical protein [Sphingosinicella sp. BN140058]QAY75562.1 hypothetical protein ETR14_02735 [Sphingosinicella sp. BN140058]